MTDADAVAEDGAGRIAEVRRLIARGEFLAAFDLARSGADGASELRYLAVLALARAGAVDRAQEELERLPQDLLDGDDRLAEDVAAVRARVLKDRALADTGTSRRRLLRDAARAYEEIHRRMGRYYTGINAATLWLLAGDRERAHDLARGCIRLTADAPRSASEDYWAAATRAEAWLVLGRTEEAADALAEAAEHSQDDWSARAVTRRQLRLVCAANGLRPEVLDPLRVPAVAHYCGHRLGERLPPSELPRVAAEAAARLRGADVGFAYGALASGADIVIAEQVIALGADLHVVLPFAADAFWAASVADAGPEWEARFERCLAEAREVVVASGSEFLGDATLFDHGSRVAMGKAIVHARSLSTSVRQIAVWDGDPARGAAGTALDVQTWQSSGRLTDVIPSGGRASGGGGGGPGIRRTMAMLFADVVGYSRMDEAQVRVFFDSVLPAVVEVLEHHEADIVLRQRWGDALHLVLSSVGAAAECALDVHEAVQGLRLGDLGLPAGLAFRIGGHAGPVFAGLDPVENRETFYGEAVTRAARIEPTTPPGQVFVTQEFAALATLEERTRIACEYVGHVDTAKGYGRFPMYVLRRGARGR